MRSTQCALVFFILAVVVFGTSGCIDYREQISFNADGSGTVAGRLFVPSRTIRQLIDGADSTLYRTTLEKLDPEEIADGIRGDGVTIRSAERTNTDSGIVLAIEYAFADLEAFRRTRGNGRDVALSEVDEMYEITLMFSGDSNGLIPSALPEERNDPSEPALEITVPTVATLDSMLAGYRVSFDVNVPTQVVSAPGGRSRGNAAVFSWSFERDGRTVLQPKTMRIIFRRDGLVWPTFEAIPYESVDRVPYDGTWNNEY